MIHEFSITENKVLLNSRAFCQTFNSSKFFTPAIIYSAFFKLQTSNLELQTNLYRKTLPTTTTPACIGIIENEAFAIEAVTKFEFGAYEVEERFLIAYYSYAFVFKYFIIGL